MTQLAVDTPTTIELNHVYLDQAERRFKEAVSDCEPQHQQQLSELCYLVYEALHRGKFGRGSFTVAITCNEEEFVVGVKKEA